MQKKIKNSGDRMKMKEISITKEQFDAYESVRNSGITNMFNFGLVIQISGLERDEINYIMENYSFLREKYLE